MIDKCSVCSVAVIMPPKKKEVEEKPALIGRLGTNLRAGIIGLPNVGKSTFFNVLTKTSIAAAENFPFCTIDPNENKYHVNFSISSLQAFIAKKLPR